MLTNDIMSLDLVRLLSYLRSSGNEKRFGSEKFSDQSSLNHHSRCSGTAWFISDPFDGRSLSELISVNAKRHFPGGCVDTMGLFALNKKKILICERCWVF